MKKFFVIMSVLLLSAPVFAMLENKKKEIIVTFSSLNQTFDILRQSPPVESMNFDEKKISVSSLGEQVKKLEIENEETQNFKLKKRKNFQKTFRVSVVMCAAMVCFGVAAVLGVTIGTAVGFGGYNSTSVNSTAIF